MPRKLIQDSWRGWYGWESRFNAVLRMSNEAMWSTNMKNDKEKQRYHISLKELEEEERDYKMKSGAELDEMKQEMITLIAAKKVYRDHNLSTYYPDPDKRIKTQITVNKTGDSVNEKRSAGLSAFKRAVNVNMAFKRDSLDIKPKAESTMDTVSLYSFNTRNPTQLLLTKQAKSDPFGFRKISNVGLQSEYPGSSPAPSIFTIAQIARLAEREEIKTNAEKQQEDRQREREARARVFPGDCKSRFTVKKFLDDKTNELAHQMSHRQRKKANLDSLRKDVKFPDVVERRKTTSAIFRDYERYKIDKKDSSLTFPKILMLKRFAKRIKRSKTVA